MNRAKVKLDIVETTSEGMKYYRPKHPSNNRALQSGGDVDIIQNIETEPARGYAVAEICDADKSRVKDITDKVSNENAREVLEGLTDDTR